MKFCKVPTEKVEELCPDPRIFYACVRGLSVCNLKKEAKETLEKWNELCEMNKCPYLKE